MTNSWWVYMVECVDNSFYTGSTTDVARRVAQHNNGTGAKYTHSRAPVKLVYCEPQPNRSAALKREIEIKKWDHQAKKVLAKIHRGSFFVGSGVRC